MIPSDRFSLNDPCCSNCGSDRIGAIQRGIDNWPVAQCFECGPRKGAIPEEPGEKRDKAIRRSAISAIGSKKAIHTALRPLVERSAYRPKPKAVEAPMLGMFED